MSRPSPSRLAAAYCRLKMLDDQAGRQDRLDLMGEILQLPPIELGAVLEVLAHFATHPDKTGRGHRPVVGPQALLDWFEDMALVSTAVAQP